MKSTGFTLTVATLVTVAGSVEAQEDWTDRVQMPVAVTRAEAAGVSMTGLRALVRSLNEDRVDPALFNETMRRLPVAEEIFVDEDDEPGQDRRDREDREEGEGDVGGFVQTLLDQGIRGRALAEAIHEELNRRGIPAGPKGRRGGPPPAARDFAPGLQDLGMEPEEIERARGPIGPAAGRDRSRSGQAGPPEGRGRGDRPDSVGPDDADAPGRGQRGGPPDRGRRGGPPDTAPDTAGGGEG
jgi:hypothetical protein